MDVTGHCFLQQCMFPGLILAANLSEGHSPGANILHKRCSRSLKDAQGCVQSPNYAGDVKTCCECVALGFASWMGCVAAHAWAAEPTEGRYGILQEPYGL